MGLAFLLIRLRMSKEDKLWNYFREVNAAVEAAKTGEASLPYQRGTFIVTALSGDIELSVKDIAEEDAILIASELSDLGIRATVQGSSLCPSCGNRVPKQAYCMHCRAPL